MNKRDEAFEKCPKAFYATGELEVCRAIWRAAWLARGRADVEAMDALEPCSYDELGYINGYSSALEQAEVAIKALDEGDGNDDNRNERADGQA